MARGLSSYLDVLTGNAMGNALRSFMPINISFLSEYPDFFAFTVVLLLIILLSIGAKESSILNNVFTTVNMITILVIIVAGSIKGKKTINSIVYKSNSYPFDFQSKVKKKYQYKNYVLDFLCFLILDCK